MTEQNDRRRNRLANETSPYLLQHADNPVDWYPWGAEAFTRARAEDRPILLSVGYSSCHWCHVMAHESFEDPEIARLMNDWFVNIKVDREERPDVDGVYMTVVQALTGSGGWPMTVFMDADGRPFFAGTYFAPADGHGRPGFPRVLTALHEAWVNERERLLSSAEGVTEHLLAATRQLGQGEPADIDPSLPAEAVGLFMERFDADWGGFGQAPKFPAPGNLEFLLNEWARETDASETALVMALHTLQRMTQGGMYDQLGGGFSRYSVDQRWLVPHFEKMLYDNAQLARVYLHAYQLTGERFYQRIARETLDYLRREMLDTEGGFYSAQDADSEGIEGKYFVWSADEVESVLGADAELFQEWFGVTPEGNFLDPHHPEFDGRSVLSATRDPDEVAAAFGMTTEALEAKLNELRERMRIEREKRVKPGLDDKILTSWNGLALAAFAEAGRILDDPDYLTLAERNADFVRAKLWDGSRLLHTYKAGVAKVDGLLEDYALYGLGLVELYRSTGDISRLEWARELLEVILRRFADEELGGFFETPVDGEQLLLRQKEYFDSATPSSNGAVALLATWLGRYHDRADWEEVGRRTVARVAGQVLQAPTGFGAVLQAFDLSLAPRRELAIVGDADARRPFEREVSTRYLPWLVLAPADRGVGLPLLEGRDAPAGTAVAFLCEGMTCQLPAITPHDLGLQLDALNPAANAAKG